MSTPCNHKWTGTVCNKSGLDDTRQLVASVVSCARTECICNAQRWVAGESNEEAVYRPFGSRA